MNTERMSIVQDLGGQFFNLSIKEAGPVTRSMLCFGFPVYWSLKRPKLFNYSTFLLSNSHGERYGERIGGGGARV